MVIEISAHLYTQKEIRTIVYHWTDEGNWLYPKRTFWKKGYVLQLGWSVDKTSNCTLKSVDFIVPKFYLKS